MEGANNGRVLTVKRKRQGSEEKGDSIEIEGMTCEQQVEQQSEEEEEDETLVVLELCDFKNHPLFDDHGSATLEGIDTARPMLRIGEYTLHGQLEETVGTSYFYDTDTTRRSEKTYQFVGQTIKKIKFTIAPPEEL